MVFFKATDSHPAGRRQINLLQGLRRGSHKAKTWCVPQLQPLSLVAPHNSHLNLTHPSHADPQTSPFSTHSGIPIPDHSLTVSSHAQVFGAQNLWEECGPRLQQRQGPDLPSLFYFCVYRHHSTTNWRVKSEGRILRAFLGTYHGFCPPRTVQHGWQRFLCKPGQDSRVR